MDIKSISYNCRAEVVNYKGVTFRSLLEGRWAAFFDSTVYAWQYEPTFAYEYFSGWLPDFAVWTRENDEPIYCEVKPINLRILPQEIKSKVDQCDKINGTIVGILGENPCVSRNPMSMGWVSKRKNDQRIWMSWTVGDMQRVKILWDNTENKFNQMSSTGDALANLASEIEWEAKHGVDHKRDLFRAVANRYYLDEV